MAGKYEHLFVRSLRECQDEMINEGSAAGREIPRNVSKPWALVSASDVADAKAFLTMSWIHPTDEPTEWVHEHVHEYDELIIWTGSDPENELDLGAEIYMDIEGERHTITTSGSVYVPAGTKHCPLGFTRVDRPFRFMALALSGDGHYLTPKERAEKAQS